MMKSKVNINTPLGTCEIIGTEEGIERISILDEEVLISVEIPKHLQDCVIQLQEYFDNKRQDFQLKLNPQGTPFQQQVWKSLLTISFSNTTSYLKQSQILGDEKAIRAVASANGKNPLWVVIPCHRVVGSDGSLTGYAGGVWRKKWLLEHEQGLKQTSLF